MKSSKAKKSNLLRIVILMLILCLAATSLMGCKKKEPPQAPTVDQEGTEEPHEPKSDPEQEAESEPEPGSDPEQEAESEPEEAELIAEDGWYYSKDDVALYIYTYGHLPDNYITKKEAKKLGWTGGSVEKFAEGMAIGGDRFGNYEGNLPDKKGRTYWECDIDTNGAKNRGAKRIIFSSDGLIFYTGDHYETFELLYGEEVR